MTYKEIVLKVAEKEGLPSQLVDRAYKAYWRAIREYITSLPFKRELSQEDFVNLRPNINVPSLGKLYVDEAKYNTKKESYRLHINKAGE